MLCYTNNTKQSGCLGWCQWKSKVRIRNFYKSTHTDRAYNVLQGCNPAGVVIVGKFRTKVLSETLEDRLLSIDEVSAKSHIQSTIQSDVKTIRNREYNFRPVGYINDEDVYNKSAILRLTEETAYTKKMKHDNIKLNEYLYIQEILDKGTLTIQESGYFFKIMHTIDSKNYKLGFKKTSNNEYILTIFHQIQDSQK